MFLQYIPLHNYSWTLIAVDNSTLLFFWVPILRLDQNLFEGSVALEVSPYAIFQACVLDASPRPCIYGMTMCPALGLAPGVVVTWLLLLSLGPELSCIVLLTWIFLCSSWLPFNTLFCTLFMAHLGYFHLTNVSLRCCNSSSKSPGVVQTDLAL